MSYEIDGISYDTDKLKFIGRAEHGHFPDDELRLYEYLHEIGDGRWLIVGECTQCLDKLDENLGRGISAVIVSDKTANAWARNHIGHSILDENKDKTYVAVISDKSLVVGRDIVKTCGHAHGSQQDAEECALYFESCNPKGNCLIIPSDHVKTREIFCAE